VEERVRAGSGIGGGRTLVAVVEGIVPGFASVGPRRDVRLDETRYQLCGLDRRDRV
jgi:hypothetical protein